MSEPRAYRICTRCVMDTSEPTITFDEQGHCNHCRNALIRLSGQVPLDQRPAALSRLVERIQEAGRRLDYDCVIGVSGGVDSSATAVWVKRLGLRALAVHVDNGWNSELAVDNIRKLLGHLEIDLDTYVIDWEEFRNLQLAFLRASVANCEAPTDHAIAATLFRTARRIGVKYILSGSNLATESIMPVSWGHYNQDLRFMKSVHRRFGTTPLRTMPTISLAGYLTFVFGHGIRQVPFLNYVDYHKDRAKETLSNDLGWRDYGGKHYESVWTRFFQGYYLPTKFGFDKRRAHLSSQICSGEITRERALEELSRPPYDDQLLREDMRFVIKKFNLTQEEFDQIMRAPARPVREFANNTFFYDRLSFAKNAFRSFATRT